MFEDRNAQYALTQVLEAMLNDESLEKVYLIIDAINECDHQIFQLLKRIISDDSSARSKIKWLMTSRDPPFFMERSGIDTSLELNSEHVSGAVFRFIDHKVNTLAGQKDHDAELQDFTKEFLGGKAEGTFLWVALVCQELTEVDARKVKEILEKIPAGLNEMYTRMLGQVVNLRDPRDAKLCQRILCAVMFTIRPLFLDEIPHFADLPKGDHNLRATNDLINHCGSFVVVQQGMVYLVHESAKEFLIVTKRMTTFDYEDAEENIARRCLDMMSKELKRNICHLKSSGPLEENMASSAVDRFIPHHIQYACQYWVYHFQAGYYCDPEPVYHFFRNHFLHWLEVLGFIKNASRATLVLEILDNLAFVSIPESTLQGISPTQIRPGFMNMTNWFLLSMTQGNLFKSSVM